MSMTPEIQQFRDGYRSHDELRFLMQGGTKEEWEKRKPEIMRARAEKMRKGKERRERVEHGLALLAEAMRLHQCDTPRALATTLDVPLGPRLLEVLGCTGWPTRLWTEMKGDHPGIVASVEGGPFLCSICSRPKDPRGPKAHRLVCELDVYSLPHSRDGEAAFAEILRRGATLEEAHEAKEAGKVDFYYDAKREGRWVAEEVRSRGGADEEAVAAAKAAIADCYDAPYDPAYMP